MYLIDGNRFYEVTNICKEVQWPSKPTVLANVICYFFNKNYFTFLDIDYSVRNRTFSQYFKNKQYDLEAKAP